MSAGRKRRTAGLDDGTRVASINRGDLHRSIVETIARGLREGTEAVALDGLAAFRSVQQLVVVDQRRETLARLARERDEAERRASRARTLAIDEADDELAGQYREDAREHSQRARRIRAEIDRLESADARALPESFTGEVDFLITALGALLAEDGRTGPEERTALRQVLRNFIITVDGATARWETELVVPAGDRVVALGPFRGSVPARGTPLAPAALKALPASSGAALERRRMRDALEAEGWPTPVARSATLAPFMLLPQVLLGTDVEWPDCPPDFDHARFNAHLRDSWTPDLACVASKYAYTSVQRQALADIVAALGGQARLDQAMHAGREHGLTQARVTNLTYITKHGLPWPPAVVRVGQWSAGTYVHDSHLRSLICPLCDQPATAVLRLPEVPEAVLCRTCRVMPSRPDLPFPPIYIDLALPRTALSPSLIQDARHLIPNDRRKGPPPRGHGTVPGATDTGH